MAFDTLEYLKQGKVDFVFRETPYDREHLIENVRKSPNKNNIIKGFLTKLLASDPLFCFAIIYDNDEFEKEAKLLIEKGLYLDDEKILNILQNTNWGKDYLISRLQYLDNQIEPKTFPKLFEIIIKNPRKYQEYIAYYKAHSNIHIRFLFMKFLLENYEDLFEVIYPDFMKYLTSVTYRENEQLTFLPELMANADICDLALLILRSKYRDKYFAALKLYILDNYPKNDLAKVFLSPIKTDIKGNSYRLEINKEGIKELGKDSDRLFLSSETEKFHIAKSYAHLISKEILERYLAYYNRFREYDEDIVALVHATRLGEKLIEFIDKYLSLSKEPTWRYIESGSTGTVYQMGDYVLKMFRTKWSYEEVICPDLYLIIKNLEEIYVRDKIGIVKCGLEVQPYLSRSASDVPKRTFELFEDELARLGYRSTDTFMGGCRGDNCRLLDSYKDANCKKPENLPDWFKETPIVLVDRDRIYPKDQERIRQLSNGY